MRDVVILTSSLRGSSSHQLEQVLKSKSINVKGVIFSKGQIKNKKKYYKRKFIKALKIGVFGSLNGIKMRKWYSVGVQKYLEIKPIDKICIENNIPFQITPTINCALTIELFKDANAEIGLSIGNGYIGPKVFNIPKWGMINIHHEVLPEYQNAQSIIWQLYNNSSITGYTIHKIDKHIDKGQLLYQEKFPIILRANLAETVSFNYSELWKRSAIGLVQVLEDFENHLDNSYPQGQGASYTTPNFFQFLKMLKNFRNMKRIESFNNTDRLKTNRKDL
jgi:methionyl-tRNA formyltransferase